MGLFSTSPFDTFKGHKLDWFYTEEAKERFSKYKSTAVTFWKYRNERLKDESIDSIALDADFDHLSTGEPSYLSKRTREYDEQLSNDNVLVFMREFLDAYLYENCNGFTLQKVFERKLGLYCHNIHFWEMISLVCYEMLIWDEDETVRPQWSYPRALKENTLLQLWLVLLKAHIDSDCELLNYSQETNNAIWDFVAMIGYDYIKEDFSKIEPKVFDPSFYKDVEYEDEFVEKLTTITSKFAKK